MTTQYNVVTYGTLTNTNGVLSNFSASNYATFNADVFNSTNIEFCFKAKFNSITNDSQIVYSFYDDSYTFSLCDIGLTGNKFYFEITDGEASLGDITGNTTAAANTDYYIKAIRNNNTYTLYSSTDGTTWTTEGTLTSSTHPSYTSAINYLGGFVSSDGIDQIINGSIDLNESYINTNGVRLWQGVTSTSNVQTRIQLRHDTAANWTSANPVLLEGEVGLELDTLKQKVGDGSTAWNSLPYDTGSTALQSITSSDITTALGYTPYNSTNPDGYITSIPSDYLQNLSSRSDALTIDGTATSSIGAINIGNGSSASGTGAISLGSNSSATGSYSTALGRYSEASGQSSIQIGYGTNSTASSLSIGFQNSNNPVNYTLLDGTTGLIPDARLSSSIARTSQIPDVSNLANNTLSNVSSIDSGSAVQTALNGKADTTLSNVSSIDANSAVQTALNGKADTSLSNLSSAGKEVLDGQWTASGQDIIASAVSLNGSSDLPYTVTLPNDGHIYEVMLRADANTTATSGNWFIVGVRTNSTITGDYVFICGAKTTANNSVGSQGTVIVPIKYGTNNLYIRRNTNYHGSTLLKAIAYRRVGTNT